MNAKPRCVFDTSVLVSALLFEQSVPGQAFYAAVDRAQIVLSEATFSELREVLARKKFDRYLTREEREQFLVRLLNQASLIDVTHEIRACRDEKDNKFLELAQSAGAIFIVTGDDDLLVLHPFGQTEVLTPKEFLERLGGPTKDEG